MKKILKSILSTTVAAAMCFSMSAASFATEAADAQSETSVTTIKHTATLYEPEIRSKIEYNSFYKTLGNVSSDAAPSIASTNNIIMMAFTDLKETTQHETSSQGGDEENGELTSSFTVSTTTNAAFYSTFDVQNKVWNTPKYIYPSSEDWMIEGVVLETHNNEIYALCVESEVSDISEETNNPFAMKMPISQIALHKYDSDTNSFSPVKLFEKEGSCLLSPYFLVDNGAPVIAWFSIPQLSFGEIMAGNVNLSCSYSKFTNNEWSEHITVATIEYDMIGDTTVPSVAANIDDELVFASVATNGEKTYLVIKDENGNVLYNEEGTPDFIYCDKLPDGNKAVYYLKDGDLYYISRDNTQANNPISKTFVAEHLQVFSGMSVSDSGNIYYTLPQSPDTLYEIRYNSNTKTYDASYIVINADSKILDSTASSLGQYDVVVILTEGTDNDIKNLNEIDADKCGSNIYFSIYNGSKKLKPNEPNSPSTSEKPNDNTEKPNETSDDNTDDDFVPPYSDDNESSHSGKEDLPDTGSSSIGVAVFALLGLASVTAIATKKKKIND